MKDLKQLIQARFKPETYNEEKRTVEVVFATDTPVRRYSWAREEYYQEILDMRGANLSRTERGLPLLNNHNMYGGIGGVIGRAENIRMENNQFIADVRFSSREDVRQIEQDVRDGIVTDVSFGYSVDKVERMAKEEGEEYRKVYVREWTPFEVSFVTVPADARAGVRSEDNDSFDLLAENPAETQERIIEEKSNPNTMTQEELDAAKRQKDAEIAAAVDVERTRIHSITDAVRDAGIEDAEFLRSLTDDKEMTAEKAAVKILARFKENDPNKGASTHVRVGADEADKRRKRMGDALVLRATPEAASKMKPEEVSAAREFRGQSLLRMAEGVLLAGGENTAGLSRREIAQRALHSTTDFPFLLVDSFQRTLRAAYQEQERTFMPFCRRATLPDFRDMSRVQLSGLVGDMDVVLEGQEYKDGSFEEAKETYRLVKYGKIVGITSESIINDDLSAFSRVPMAFAAASARKQSDLVYAILLNNPNMGDGNPLFDNTNHGNYITSNGTVLNRANLDIAYEKMFTQKDLNGKFINVRPQYLIVGAKNRLKALELTGQNFIANQQANIADPAFAGMQVIIDPRITNYEWFLSASPAAIDTIEYAFLDGEEELFIEQEEGFRTDSLQIKARMVFGAKAIDWRGLFKNDGAAS